jgi:hypothetical protein
MERERKGETVREREKPFFGQINLQNYKLSFS